MDVTVSARAAALWVALHLLLLLVLSMRVVRQRAKHKVMFGDEGAPSLTRAVRVFGNAAEYVPAGLAALVLMALVQASPLVIHVMGGGLLAGRIAHAVGLTVTDTPNPARAGGVIITWLAYIYAAVALLFYAIG
ncbi:MAG: MAPEG family protein [Caulobacteraceae bacterium]|nr:MAPEG family protein [Caulobacteraceae bacterium]